jgi:predicted extracellular nuclease
MATTLTAGDVALIGYSSDTAGKSFAFVLLTDVDAGTAINFTDDGWFAAGGFRSGEGEVTYTAPAGGATAGTVITFSGLTGSMNFSTSGDSLIAFQGPFTPASAANGGAGVTNLFALDFADGNAAFEADASSSNASAVPAGLSSGSTALAFTLDNGAYVGPTTGTKAQLLANIADSANWHLDDGAPQPYATAFSVTSAGLNANVSIGDQSITEGDAGTKILTFTVTRDNAAGDFTVDFGTHDGSATAGSDYLAAAGTLHFTAGGALSQTISVTINGDATPEPSETFTVNLSNLMNVTGTATLAKGSATGTILNDDIAHVAIFDIQGAAHTSPYLGQTVITQGVVTATDTTGYWIQDEHGDGNAATSDAVFVFTNATPTNVHIGDLVSVQGKVAEYDGGQTNNLTITELDSPTNVQVLGSGHTVAATLIGPDGVLPPTSVIQGDPSTFDPAHDAIDFYESLEGMVVTVEGAQAVSNTISGATWVVADHGLEATGMNSRGGITLSDGDFNPERIQVYADSGVLEGFTPNYVMGEQLGNVTGVLSYFGGNYELVATQVPTNGSGSGAALPKEVTALHGDGAHLTVGAYNLENLDPNDGSGKFATLGSDIAHNLGGPDILGVEEIQDSNGTGSGVLDATQTLNELVAAIDAAGGPHYAWVEVDPTAENSSGGEPGGNIRSAILYNADRVHYVGGSVRLVADDTVGAAGDAFHNSRQPIAADFTFHGEQVTFVDVHDYSRGGSQELFGANQPALNNGDDRREDQTAALLDFVHALEQARPDDHVIVGGDFNGYYFEKTLTQLEANGDLVNLVETLSQDERYSYLFEGNSQQLDNLLVSHNLTAGALFDNVHLNTGQPDSANPASDHDPILSQLYLDFAPTAVGDTSGVLENAQVSIDVLDNDADDNGDALSVVLGSAKSALGATITVDHGHVLYTADADSFDLLAPGATVQDSFTYKADDGFGGVSDAVTVTVTVTGAHDNVTLSGTNHDDVFTDVAGGRDTTYDGGNGADTINGLDGSDHLSGGNGDDTLNGGTGIDFLDGGNGNDVLNGGDGDDTLTGGNGSDTYIGGAGHDTFILGNGSDLIADLNPAEDVIKAYGGEGLGGRHLTWHDVDLNGDHVADSVVLLGANNGQVTLQGWTLESLVEHNFLTASHQAVGDWLA